MLGQATVSSLMKMVYPRVNTASPFKNFLADGGVTIKQMSDETKGVESIPDYDADCSVVNSDDDDDSTIENSVDDEQSAKTEGSANSTDHYPVTKPATELLLRPIIREYNSVLEEIANLLKDLCDGAEDTVAVVEESGSDSGDSWETYDMSESSVDNAPCVSSSFGSATEISDENDKQLSKASEDSPEGLLSPDSGTTSDAEELPLEITKYSIERMEFLCWNLRNCGEWWYTVPKEFTLDLDCCRLRTSLEAFGTGAFGIMAMLTHGCIDVMAATSRVTIEGTPILLPAFDFDGDDRVNWHFEEDLDVEIGEKMHNFKICGRIEDNQLTKLTVVGALEVLDWSLWRAAARDFQRNLAFAEGLRACAALHSQNLESGLEVQGHETVELDDHAAVRTWLNALL